MEEPKMKEHIGNITRMLGETWKGALVTAGILGGLFQHIDSEEPVTLKELSRKTKYDEGKLDKWLYYMTQEGVVNKDGEHYTLTPKGVFFSPASPLKDLFGLIQINEYYMNAALSAGDTFKKNKSLDKLSEGKVSRLYQPKVSDNFSAVLFEYFQQFNMKPEDSLLDLGCGNGSFLRIMAKMIPEIKFTGIDTNLFAIEKAKKENQMFGLADRIELLVGDITEDMKDFAENSYDWVTGINIFHFIEKSKRMDVLRNMLRIARKGIFYTQVLVESAPMTAAADPLMSLLWNDFSGFFRKEEADEMNRTVREEYPDFQEKVFPVLMDTSNLVVVLKQ